MTLGVMEDARLQLMNMLYAWDFTNYFPGDYDSSLAKKVEIVAEFPDDQLTNLQTASSGMLTIPIISVTDLMGPTLQPSGAGRALGNVLGAGTQAGTIRYGQVLRLSFQVACWADLQVGGGDQAERLAGGVFDAVFVNQNALTSFRRLEAAGGRLLKNDVAQLWMYPVTVSGTLVQSYDK